MVGQIVAGSLALIFAVAAGLAVGAFFVSLRNEALYKKSVASKEGSGKWGINRASASQDDNSLTSRVINYMKGTKKRSKSALQQNEAKTSKLGDLIRLAGLDGEIGVQNVRDARTRFVAGIALLGAMMGLAFSPELSVVLAIVGGVLGWQLPVHALKTRVAKRAHDAERNLPEMLDVIALCMRSGLSIDVSIDTYARHFDTILAREFESARRKWSSGLERREDALKKLADTYDSVVLGRVIDTIIRSARFGSSMIASLESDSSEARSEYQSMREERIVKAPVKMMIPTGVLILPAMLIMVLGPVLLEFAEGGI